MVRISHVAIVVYVTVWKLSTTTANPVWRFKNPRRTQIGARHDVRATRRRTSNGAGTMNRRRIDGKTQNSNTVHSKERTKKTLPDLPQTTKATLFALSSISLVMMIMNSMVSLYPSQALIEHWGAKHTTTVLSSVTTAAAAIEMTGAGIVSRWLQRTAQHRQALLMSSAVPAVVNAVVAVLLSQQALPPMMIVLSRGAGILSFAVFLLTSQTLVVTDPFLSRHPASLASAMGTQVALVGIGFLVGMVLAGKVLDPVVLYRLASGSGFAVVALILLNIPLKAALRRDTADAPAKASVQKRNPWRPSRKTIIFMLLTLPMFMGDFFLVFIKSQWNLDAAQISTLLALFGGSGIVANVAVGRFLLPNLGLRNTTALAILGRLMQTSATIWYGYRGLIITVVALFWSSAHSLGLITTMDVQERTQGTLKKIHNHRHSCSLIASAAATAMLKILGPCIYSAMYIQGQAWWGQSHLPFYFNLMLSVVALAMTVLYL